MLTDDDAKKNIADNLQRLIRERGLKQSEIAEAVGESRMRVSLAVRGKKLPSAAFLARIAEALNSSVDVLLSPHDETSQSVR